MKARNAFDYYERAETFMQDYKKIIKRCAATIVRQHRDLTHPMMDFVEKLQTELLIRALILTVPERLNANITFAYEFYPQYHALKPQDQDLAKRLAKTLSTFGDANLQDAAINEIIDLAAVKIENAERSSS